MKQELQLTTLNFGLTNQPVRFFKDDTGEVWFVAKDVCDILGLKYVTKALKVLDSDEKDVKPIQTLGGTQEMNIISESGRNRLTLRCDKPQAKPFQDWVVKEILPSIRKTGSYSIVKPDTMTQIGILEQAIGILKSHEQKLNNLEARMDSYEQKAVPLLEAPKDMSKRAMINMVIRNYASSHGNSREDFRHYYNDLFYDFLYRYHIDLKKRTKNLGNRFIMQTAEQIGCLDDLYKVATQIFAK